MYKTQLVDDPVFEHDTVIAEQLEQALLASVQQQAAAGAIPPADLARIMELVKNNDMELAGAIDKVQKEAQERQATLVEEMAPEAQPGLAMPGVGAESPVAPPPMEREPSIDELMAAL